MSSPADLKPEPEGFWTPIHQQLAQWVAVYQKDKDANKRAA